MIPYIQIPPIRLGPIVLQPFGYLIAIGIVIGTILAGWRAKRLGLDPGVVGTLVRLSAFFGITGSHVVHLVVYHPEELAHDPWSLLKFWSGMSSFGGFISATVAVAIYLARKRIPFLPYAEAVLFGFFPAWLFGRIGCATAHDHPGCLTHFFLAVKFPDGPRHDLGLDEVFLSFFWIPLLYWLGRKGKVDDPPRGTILSAMIIAYSVPRFFLDFLRATDVPYHDVRYFGLTPAQYAAVALTVVSVLFLLRLRAQRATVSAVLSAPSDRKLCEQRR